MNNTVTAFKCLALRVHFTFITWLWMIRSSRILSTGHASVIWVWFLKTSSFIHFKVFELIQIFSVLQPIYRACFLCAVIRLSLSRLCVKKTGVSSFSQIAPNLSALFCSFPLAAACRVTSTGTGCPFTITTSSQGKSTSFQVLLFAV